jgi:hypothetical protein
MIRTRELAAADGDGDGVDQKVELRGGSPEKISSRSQGRRLTEHVDGHRSGRRDVFDSDATPSTSSSTAAS